MRSSTGSSLFVTAGAAAVTLLLALFIAATAIASLRPEDLISQIEQYGVKLTEAETAAVYNADEVTKERIQHVLNDKERVQLLLKKRASMGTKNFNPSALRRDLAGTGLVGGKGEQRPPNPSSPCPLTSKTMTDGECIETSGSGVVSNTPGIASVGSVKIDCPTTGKVKLYPTSIDCSNDTEAVLVDSVCFTDPAFVGSVTEPTDVFVGCFTPSK